MATELYPGLEHESVGFHLINLLQSNKQMLKIVAQNFLNKVHISHLVVLFCFCSVFSTAIAVYEIE